ncbi:MAG: hypothetical protein U9R44_03270 [Candidatus Omnitrophota bacterium]|nr:hypothetical protein [Candidatus Omnitrophota bacterium]
MERVMTDGILGRSAAWRHAMEIYNKIGLNVNKDNLTTINLSAEESTAALTLLKRWHNDMNYAAPAGAFDLTKKIIVVNTCAVAQYALLSESRSKKVSIWADLVTELMQNVKDAYFVFTSNGEMEGDFVFVADVIKEVRKRTGVSEDNILLPKENIFPFINDILGVSSGLVTLDTGLSHMGNGVYAIPTAVITGNKILHWLPPRDNVAPIIVDTVEALETKLMLDYSENLSDEIRSRLKKKRLRPLIEGIKVYSEMINNMPERKAARVAKLAEMSIQEIAGLDRELLKRRLDFPSAEQDLRRYLTDYIRILGLFEPETVPEIIFVDSAAQTGIGVPRFKAQIYVSDEFQYFLLIDKSYLEKVVTKDGREVMKVSEEVKGLDVVNEVFGHMLARAAFPEFARAHEKALRHGDTERVIHAKTVEEVLAGLMALLAIHRMDRIKPGFLNNTVKEKIRKMGVDISSLDIDAYLEAVMNDLETTEEIQYLRAFRYKKMLMEEGFREGLKIGLIEEYMPALEGIYGLEKEDYERRQDTPQIGKRARARTSDLRFTRSDKSKAEVDVYKPGIEEKAGILELTREDMDPVKKMREDTENLKFKNRSHKELILAILSLLEHSPPAFYAFDTLIEDLFGFASEQHDLIALHKDLAADPIALFHEIGEYLLSKKGHPPSEFTLSEVEGLGTSGTSGPEAGGLRLRLREKELAVDAGGVKKVIDITGALESLRQDKEEWVNWDKETLNRPENRHYLLRILQREVFGGRDRDLTGDIKKRMVSAWIRKISPEGIKNKSEEEAALRYSVIADNDLYTLKEEAAKGVEEAVSQKASSIIVDGETGGRRYFKQGDPFIPLQAHVYVMEGRSLNMPSGVELPAYMDKAMKRKEGALLLTTGPFYVKKKGAPSDRYIRPLSDREVYERFGLRRVYGKDGQPFEIPVLGIGGRSILLPVPYTVALVRDGEGIRIVRDEKDYQDGTLEKRSVFGFEFKAAGVAAYRRHNFSFDFPSTTYEEHAGKPGIFLDWWYQLSTRTPVGLGFLDVSSVSRELLLLEKGADLTRWTLDTLRMDQYHGISLRVPVGDYRRLSVFFEREGRPDKDVFNAIIEESGLTVSEYLSELSRNYGKSMRIILETGILESQLGSIIDSDIFGHGTDFGDFHEISGISEDFFRDSVYDSVDNLVNVLKIAGPENEHIINRALREFAVRFFGGPEQIRGLDINMDDTDELKDRVFEYARSLQERALEKTGKAGGNEGGSAETGAAAEETSRITREARERASAADSIDDPGPSETEKDIKSIHELVSGMHEYFVDDKSRFHIKGGCMSINAIIGRLLGRIRKVKAGLAVEGDIPSEMLKGIPDPKIELIYKVMGNNEHWYLLVDDRFVVDVVSSQVILGIEGDVIVVAAKEEAAEMSDWYKDPEKSKAYGLDLKVAEDNVDDLLLPIHGTIADSLIAGWIRRQTAGMDEERAGKDATDAGEAVTGMDEGDIPETSRGRLTEEEIREIEKMIKGTNIRGRQVFTRVRAYLDGIQDDDAKAKKKGFPIDIVIDLTLIPEDDIRENMETWAYLILACLNLENVNFIFEIPDITGKGPAPSALIEEADNAAAEQDAVSLLREKIKAKALLFRLSGNIDELVEKRINAARRENAVEVSIISKAYLEWAREEDIKLAPNQYPVALDGITAIKDKGVLLRNFEAALTVGLAKAALAIAKRRDAGKSDEEEKELPPLKKRLLERLKKLYGVFREDVTVTDKTLDNMIHPSSTVRLNLAISLALPPVTRMYFEKLRDFHDNIQLALQAV